MSRRILDTRTRKRLAKEIGMKKLRNFEDLILKERHVEKVILETPARARLRKKLGRKELDRLESAILRGEF